MGIKSRFEKDFQIANVLFPKLNCVWNSKNNFWAIYGELDICDQEGDYWNTFKIVVYVPKTYPYCIPLVKEKSEIVDREDDWHINEEGLCCVDIIHNLLFQQRKGINISDFLKFKVYPYFANQVYKKNFGTYAAGEYMHHFNGIKQFYVEDLRIGDVHLAIKILKMILNNRLPGRNDECPCGGGKFKNCHWSSIDFLKSISKEQLRSDLVEFSSIL